MIWNNPSYWTYAQISLLWELVQDHTPVQEISYRIGKPYEEICRKAAELGITLPVPSYASRAPLPSRCH